ncbi:MAG TPA: tetratricopeptide repeat protein [Gammaproteobacteria bacterium]|nr:tetratricopeptide repeat protein [Gammaproteobacteria bacterium]
MADAANTPPSFFARLKQHHIYRVVVVYAVACWVLLQIGNSLFPDFGLSHGEVRYLIVALLLLFPVVLVLAWMLIKPQDPAKYTSWQRLHWKLGSALAVVVLALVVVSGVFMWRAAERRHATRLAAEQAAVQAAAKPAAASFNPPADSIVVLPFANLGGDSKQQYFSDGITEELTNALGENTVLRIIAWNTAVHYRGSTQTPAEIGKALNVAHLVDGSIQREGNEVRVSAELVSTVTGYQLWSAHYDDSLKNIFAVQDRISAAIAGALQVKFARLQAVPTHNPRAHEFYLKGLAAMNRHTAADVSAAQRDFQQALKLDPNYADAWAWLAHSYNLLSELSTLPLKEAQRKSRAAVDQALLLDPHNVNALVELGNADLNNNHIAEAREKYEQALALDPSNAPAHVNYGNVLPLKPGLAQYQEAVLLDPDNVNAQNDLAVQYQDLGDWAQMAAVSQTVNKLSPHDIDAAFGLAFAYTKMQRGEDAVKAFDLVQPSTPLDRQLVNAGRRTYQALLTPALRPKALAALVRLRRATISPTAQADLLQMYLALEENKRAIKMLPGFCAASPVGCSDLAINPIYAPLHGDPRFEKLSQRYTTITLK